MSGVVKWTRNLRHIIIESQAGNVPPPNSADSTPNARAALRDEDVPSLVGNDDRSDDEIHVYDA